MVSRLDKCSVKHVHGHPERRGSQTANMSFVANHLHNSVRIPAQVPEIPHAETQSGSASPTHGASDRSPPSTPFKENIMTNPVCVVGTVATAPRLIRTQSGVSLCSFRLASTERRYNREAGEWSDGDTNWFTVSVFRDMAGNAATSFAKGDRVVVTGRLRVRRWEQKEKDRSGLAVEIDADALGHDLRWGISRFTKHSAGHDPEHESSEQELSATQERDLVAPVEPEDTPTSDGFIPVAP